MPRSVLPVLIAIVGICIGQATLAMDAHLNSWADAQRADACYRDGGTEATCGAFR